jgi:enterochelin esterase-like enzyme
VTCDQRPVTTSALPFLGALLVCLAPPSGAQTKLLQFQSKILNESRFVHVNLPPNYGLAHQRYEVIYVLDGHAREFFDLAVASAEYDLVPDAHEYATPPQIVVGVDQRDRSEELGRDQERFTRFLVEELVPFIDRTYRTSGFRTLIGHSLGGRFALMTMCRAPGAFPAIVAISPAGGDTSAVDAITKCLGDAATSNPNVVRQIVLSGGDREPRVLAGVKRLGEYLRTNAPPSWRWTIINGAGLGHTDTPLATIPPGIRFVHDKSVWEMPPPVFDSVATGLIDPEHGITAFYAGLSTRVGSKIEPSRKWMLAAADIHIKHRDPNAEEAVRRLIAAYPEELEGYGMLAELALARRDTAAAKRALDTARGMLDRLDMHDAFERERKRQVIDGELFRLRDR